jgi:hypothetical protein
MKMVRVAVMLFVGLMVSVFFGMPVSSVAQNASSTKSKPGFSQLDFDSDEEKSKPAEDVVPLASPSGMSTAVTAEQRKVGESSKVVTTEHEKIRLLNIEDLLREAQESSQEEVKSK